MVKDADHHFTIRACDWGFREFVALSELRDATSGFVVDDKLVISARVRVEPQVGQPAFTNPYHGALGRTLGRAHRRGGDSAGRARVCESQVNWWNWDSKKETGHVGLKNQGATCYINSLLQVACS